MQIQLKLTTVSAFASLALASAICLAGPAAADDVSPTEVYATLRQAIREALSMEDPTSTKPYWLSLTTVGSVVKTSDQKQINDLANFCPPPSPILSSFVREPKLDVVYERIIQALVIPHREYSAKYMEFRADLYESDGITEKPILIKYNELEKAKMKALVEWTYAQGPADRALKETDWRQAALRFDNLAALVDPKLLRMAREQFANGTKISMRRQAALDVYRAAAVSGSDSYNSFNSPLSEFSPAVSAWPESDGWLKVSLDTQHTSSHYNRTIEERNGFGGLNLGFISIGGSGASKSDVTQEVTHVKSFSYTFVVKRVTIRRPWFDSSVLLEPESWTWEKPAGASDATPFPRVSNPLVEEVPADASNAARTEILPRDVPKDARKFAGKDIVLALLPVELVIAKDLEVTATVSDADFQQIDTQSKISGSVGFFGLFSAGGGGSTTVSDIKKSGGSTTFTLKSTGISVIGLISQVVPLCPNPGIDSSMRSSWGPDAWIPSAKPPTPPAPDKSTPPK